MFALGPCSFGGCPSLKEKVLGAHRNGRDLMEIPASIRNRMKFNFVSHINGLLESVLLDKKPAKLAKRRLSG